MKQIIFDDGNDAVTMDITENLQYVKIENIGGKVFICTLGIDKIIEALYLIKKELNLE